jgi:hypothetical protein
VIGPAEVGAVKSGTLTTGLLDLFWSLDTETLEITDSARFTGGDIRGNLDAREVQMNYLAECRASVIFNWETRRYERTSNMFDCIEGPPQASGNGL